MNTAITQVEGLLSQDDFGNGGALTGLVPRHGLAAGDATQVQALADAVLR